MKLLPGTLLPIDHPYLFNKYTQWYYDIIENAKIRIFDKITYVEKHHIIPESLFINRSRNGIKGSIDGNPNSINNIVNLTAREHYIVHQLLVKMTIGLSKKKMLNAIWHMIIHPSKKRGYKITARLYENIRKDISDQMKNRIVLDETKKKLSKYNTGRKRLKEIGIKIGNSNRGRKDSDETKKLKSNIAKNRPPMKDETKKKLSIHNTGKKQSEETKQKKKNKIWITNGILNRLINNTDIIPIEWIRGLTNKYKSNQRHWITNGTNNRKIDKTTVIPIGWEKGMVNKNSLKGKTYEEIYGPEKAKIICQLKKEKMLSKSN